MGQCRCRLLPSRAASLTIAAMSALIDGINRRQRILRGGRLLGDHRLAAFLVQRGEWPGDYSLAPNDCVLWKPLNLRFSRARLESWTNQGASLQRMSRLGIRFSDDENGALFAESHGITVEIDGEDSLSTFREVIVDEAYRATLPESCVVLDIGANDGFASLYFASNPRVAAVYAYEPFAPTLEQLRRNAALNPEIASKITPQGFGLAAQDGSATIRYTPAKRASLSLFWDAAPPDAPDATEEKIELRSVLDVLGEVRGRHPGQPIVLKLDCEGAEREIIAALVGSDALGDVPILMGETHDLSENGHADIVAPLGRAGYVVFSHRADNPALGLFYAVRSDIAQAGPR